MDQATVRSTDPTPATSRAERRRRLRHRPHSPVYASFKVPQAGKVVDLSELLDLSEDGFAVHTAEPLEANHPVTLTLDLPETGAYIHGNGVAVWSDSNGRGGIRFSDLSETSRRALKEWLFVNLLVACVNHAARTEQRSLAAAQDSAPALSQPPSPMEALREQVRACGDDTAKILNLIVQNALEWTGAGGGALASLSNDHMTCRARSGEMAPPLGAAVDANHGLSGECVRSRQMVIAEDTETDARVDRETCRALGIGSILAVPVIEDSRVLGLLEVFSPRPRAFTQAHAALLQSLVEVVPRPESLSQSDPVNPEVPGGSPVQEQREKPESPPKALYARPFSRNLYLVVIAAVAIGATLAGYLSAPAIQRRLQAADSRLPAVSAAAPQPNSNHSSSLTSLQELRRLAESGDAESQYWMAIHYSTGASVIQNDTEAAKWFQRAANQGHVQAQARLASWYWSGRGVPKDLLKAYFWARLAWAGGDENSKLLLEGLASQMARSQVLAAQQQANDWLHQHSESQLSH